jgi:poly(3-hydroxybutyrate) depolymerase
MQTLGDPRGHSLAGPAMCAPEHAAHSMKPWIAMAAVMGATYPDLYAAVGVHSGLPYKSAADLPSAFAMRGDAGSLGLRSRKSRGAASDGVRIRTIVLHGDADNIVHPSNAAGIVGTVKEGESIECAEARNTAAR